MSEFERRTVRGAVFRAGGAACWACMVGFGFDDEGGGVNVLEPCRAPISFSSSIVHRDFGGGRRWAREGSSPIASPQAVAVTGDWAERCQACRSHGGRKRDGTEGPVCVAGFRG